MDLEDLGTIRRIKLEQCVQLCQFENDANQVNRWIHSAEGKFSDGSGTRISGFRVLGVRIAEKSLKSTFF